MARVVSPDLLGSLDREACLERLVARDKLAPRETVVLLVSKAILVPRE